MSIAASRITAAQLSELIEDLAGTREKVQVAEEGVVLFKLSESHYSVSDSSGKALLHLWSDERNVVRRVLDAELKNNVLRLTVQRFGKTEPCQLEFLPCGDSRSASAKKAARSRYATVLQRALLAQNPASKLLSISTGMDLEHSFSPIYTRAQIRQGNSSFAVLGVNASEMQASVESALGFGLLWLDACRQRGGTSDLVGGLKLFVPPGSSAVVRQRMANLNRDIAKWELYELDERTEQWEECDTGDAGNIATRLVHAPDKNRALQRFAQSIAHVLSIVPDSETIVVNPSEVVFRLHGLHFAGARFGNPRFGTNEQLYFGVRAAEFPVTNENQAEFRDYLRHVSERRNSRNHADALYRAVPERWLESLLVRDVTVLDSRLDGLHVYSQVPAFAACDRAMIDVLTSTHDGRLAVLELKADEDIQLPLQGLDYWARVRFHNERREFQQFGYFSGRQLSTADPLLLFVAPALRVHPTTDTILRYISPRIDWTFLAVDERWRDGPRVIFRKQPKKQS